MADAPTMISTGIPNLDRVLGGGILRGSLVLVLGVPGAGKTTLAAQAAFAAARAGKTALIMTALAEPVSKLITHLQQFAFFDSDLVGGPVQFHSIEQLLPEGLESTGEQIVATVRQVKADVIVLDGFRGMRGVAEDPQAARHFLYTIGATLGALGVTTYVTAVATPTDHEHFPESTTADVILSMHYRLAGVRHHRGVEVVKVRGAAPLPGLHAVTLGHNGIQVYPLLEERVAASLRGSGAQIAGAAQRSAVEGEATAGDGFFTGDVDEEDDVVDASAERARVAFGLPAVDVLLNGGLTRETSTLLAGSLGTGKTLLALHFALAGVREGDPVVYASFRETRAQLLRAADAFSIGPELRRAVRPGGGLTLLDVLAITVQPDVFADHLLSILDQTDARRLVIDSIGEIEDALTEEDMEGGSRRHKSYLTALVSALHARGITTLYIKETSKAISPTLDFSTDPLAVVAENVLLVQQMPIGGYVRRVLSVLKMRYSEHDTAVREFRITSPEGVTMLGPLSGDEQRSMDWEQARLQQRHTEVSK